MQKSYHSKAQPAPKSTARTPHPEYVMRPTQRMVADNLLAELDAALARDPLNSSRLRFHRRNLRRAISENSWHSFAHFLLDMQAGIESELRAAEFHIARQAERAASKLERAA